MGVLLFSGLGVLRLDDHLDVCSPRGEVCGWRMMSWERAEIRA